MQTYFTIGPESLLAQHFAVGHQVCSVDAASGRVVEVAVTAVHVPHDVSRAQAHLALGVEVLTVQEEGAADPQVAAVDDLATPLYQVATGEAQVTAHIRPVQGHRSQDLDLPDDEICFALKQVGDDSWQCPALPLHRIRRGGLPQIHRLLEHAVTEMNRMRKLRAGQVKTARHPGASHAYAIQHLPP